MTKLPSFLLLPLLLSLHQATASEHLPPPPPSHTPTLCTSEHMLGAVQTSSHCKPMVKVLKLDIPGNGSFTQMTPQFVSAYQCGGGCHTPSHSCVSTTRVSRLIPVLLSQCGMSAGQCAKSCATLTIEEDSECQCACLQQQRICANARHSFNRDTCTCECQVEEEYTLCRDQGRVWDIEECVCRCSVEMVKQCSTGFSFDSLTCSCILKEANDIKLLVSDDRVVRSDTVADDDEKYAELIIMAALAGIATVFFIIIISLLSSIKSLNSTIRSIEAHKSCLIEDTSELSSEQSLLATEKL